MKPVEQVSAFLRYPRTGLYSPDPATFWQRVDSSAIISRTLVKTFGVFRCALRENIWRHETHRAREFVQIYQSLIQQKDPAFSWSGLCLLEVGAGPGAVACAFREKGAQVVALDLWDGRIFTHPAIEFVVGNATHLDLPANSFDAVSLTSVLHHISAPSGVLCFGKPVASYVQAGFCLSKKISDLPLGLCAG